MKAPHFVPFFRDEMRCFHALGNHFLPNANCTREQFVVFMYKTK